MGAFLFCLTDFADMAKYWQELGKTKETTTFLVLCAILHFCVLYRVHRIVFFGPPKQCDQFVKFYGKQVKLRLTKTSRGKKALSKTVLTGFERKKSF